MASILLSTLCHVQYIMQQKGDMCRKLNMRVKFFMATQFGCTLTFAQNVFKLTPTKT